MFRHFHFLTLLWLSTAVLGFSPSSVSIGRRDSTKLQAHSSQGTPTRRNILEVFGVVAASSFVSPPASAASGLDLESYLYKVVRVREATQQERRLIQTGKFKDKARQNVKLAVKFMIQNYQLSDSINGASAYLTGNSAQMRAIDVGQSAVQSLQTILEYFDTSDVENIKVDSLAGKEGLVVKGLESAQLKIDDFLSYFPEETVASIRKKIQEENELNVKEFDPSLGNIINLPSSS